MAKMQTLEEYEKGKKEMLTMMAFAYMNGGLEQSISEMNDCFYALKSKKKELVYGYYYQKFDIFNEFLSCKLLDKEDTTKVLDEMIKLINEFKEKLKDVK